MALQIFSSFYDNNDWVNRFSQQQIVNTALWMKLPGPQMIAITTAMLLEASALFFLQAAIRRRSRFMEKCSSRCSNTDRKIEHTSFPESLRSHFREPAPEEAPWKNNPSHAIDKPFPVSLDSAPYMWQRYHVGPWSVTLNHFWQKSEEAASTSDDLQTVMMSELDRRLLTLRGWLESRDQYEKFMRKCTVALVKLDIGYRCYLSYKLESTFSVICKRWKEEYWRQYITVTKVISHLGKQW